MPFNIYELIWIFLISGIIGIIVETIWCLIKNRRIERRGSLVICPFNLVYSFGGVWMTLSLYSLSEKRELVIMLVGALIGSVWEYLCSLFQERVFGSISWNYKDLSMNLHGRISLQYAFFWGILAVLWIKDALPKIMAVIRKIPLSSDTRLAYAVLIIIIFDSVLSAAILYRAKQRGNGAAPKNAFEKWLDRHFPNEKISRLYPNMTFITR